MTNQRDGLNMVRLGILALALTTAIIHVVLAIPVALVAFYLNALGYIILTAAFLLPQLGQYRRYIRLLFMGFTGLTIVLWLVFGQPYTTIGYIDKTIEIGLLVLLWLDLRASSTGKTDTEEWLS